MSRKGMEKGREFSSGFRVAARRAFRRFWEAFGPPRAWKMSVSCTRDAHFEKRTFLKGGWVWEGFWKDFGWYWEAFGEHFGSKIALKKEAKNE